MVGTMSMVEIMSVVGTMSMVEIISVVGTMSMGRSMKVVRMDWHSGDRGAWWKS